MSQPVGFSIRELLEVDASFEANTPPADQLLVLLRSMGVGAEASATDQRAIELQDFGRVRTSPGAVAWNDGCLDDAVVAVLAIWLLAYFDGHELWMADGSGEIAFRVEPLTLFEKLKRKSAGEQVIDRDRPPNL